MLKEKGERKTVQICCETNKQIPKKLGKALVKIRENEENLSNIEEVASNEKLEIYEKQKIARDGSSIKQL